MRKQLLTAVLLMLSFTASARDIPAADAPCDQAADPARWASAGTPDKGLQPAMISAHRGGVTLAPENTLAAYEIAFAYGVDLVEIDVRETLDGRFFSMHDGDVDRTTDGTGGGDYKLASQIAQLNAADYEPWKGGEYDPSPVPFLEDILELAERTGKGIEFDIKSVRNYPLFLLLISQYPGVYERSYFNASGAAGQALRLVQPRVRLIYNLGDAETPESLYEEAGRSAVFGSALAKFSAEAIAAIHDGCGYVLPHSYDQGHEHEAEQFLLGRSLGIDGAQVDQPDVIRAVMDDPVPTKLVAAAEAADRACLVNADNELGLPYKRLRLTGADGKDLDPVETRKAGCAQLPRPVSELQIRFEGDASARSAELGTAGGKSALIAGRFGGALSPLLMLPMLLLSRMRRHARQFLTGMLMTTAVCTTTACTRIPGAIDPPGKATIAPPARVEPVIRCAPDAAVVASADGKNLEVAACAPTPAATEQS